MINTKKINIEIMGLTPAERKSKVKKLREEHEDYFQKEGNLSALYIPKMAYRPTGKDELHVSFFPSEMEKEKDIYTEFVSIDYESEDPKRTLYLHKYNPHWKAEYELITSNSGFQRHLIPVGELKVVSDVTSRLGGMKVSDPVKVQTIFDLPNPDDKVENPVAEALKELNETLKTIRNIMQKLSN
jgi:hypothetical protein